MGQCWINQLTVAKNLRKLSIIVSVLTGFKFNLFENVSVYGSISESIQA